MASKRKAKKVVKKGKPKKRKARKDSLASRAKQARHAAWLDARMAEVREMPMPLTEAFFAKNAPVPPGGVAEAPSWLLDWARDRARQQGASV